jgi:D-sedoheptulose 7-phosphate isomerase
MKESIKEIAKKNNKISEFAVDYFNRLLSIFNNLDLKKLDKLEVVLKKARLNKNNIFVFGNGGSAATASTMANDLGFDILKKTSIKTPFKFFALTDNTPVITAISNDTGYENVLINQLRIHFQKKDTIILISDRKFKKFNKGCKRG